MNWFDRHFVANWRTSWRWFSVQTAAVSAAVGGAIAASPELLLQLVMFLPEEGWLRWALVASVVIVMFIVPTIARLWDQEEHDDPAQD